MAIPLNDNIQIDAPKPSDSRYLSSTNAVWANVAAVNAGIPLTKRHEGLTVNIAGVEYWWVGGAWVVKLPDLSNKADLIGGKVPSSQLPSYIDTHISNTSNPHSVTKTQVGLGNVDNTSDANKPISTATQTALNAKENTITAGTTSQYYRGDKTWQNLSNLATQVGEEFYYDENNILRPNISTYRQVIISNTAPIPIITLDFEPTFIQSVIINNKPLMQNQYIYTAPNQLDLSTNIADNPKTIEITYDHFINQPDNTL